MKFLLRTLIGLAVSALIVVAIGYFLQDANRFKPEIQAFIKERTGVQVDITGDLNWRFFRCGGAHRVRRQSLRAR